MKVKGRELAIPLIFMGICISYIVAIVDVSLLSIVFSILILSGLVPILIVLIRKSIVKENVKEREENPTESVRRFLSVNIRNIAKNKQAQMTVIFIFCFGVIGYVLGFIGFMFVFTLLVLLWLGVRKLTYLIGLPIGITLAIDFIFMRLLHCPLPQGIFYY